MQETKNIMLVANQKYLIPMFTMLTSLFSNNEGAYDIYLFSSDFTDEQFRIAQKFCNFWRDKRIIPISMKDYKLKGLGITERFPVEVYFKILGIDFLPESVQTVLVLDLDMIVAGNVQSIFELDMQSYALGACMDMYAYVYGEAKRNNTRLKLPENQTYFNAGFMYYNLEYIRSCGGSKFLMEQAYTYSEVLKWPEQDLLNVVFGDKCRYLDWNRYNCPPIMYVMKESDVTQGKYRPLYQEEIVQMVDFDGYMNYTQAICNQAKIIHYIGEAKPWDMNRPQSETYEIFDAQYKIYLEKAIQILEQQ